VFILFINTSRKLGLQTQTLGTELSFGAQADARGATQVLSRFGQAVARGSCLSQVFDRFAEIVTHGAVPWTSHVRDLGAQAGAQTAACSQVPDRSAQAVARGAIPCAPQVLERGAEAVARGAARYAPQLLDRGAKAGVQTVSCGDAALPHQEKILGR
jgi:hypothetical protein